MTDIRIGQGYDVHAFGEGDHVVLGGVRIAHERGKDPVGAAGIGLGYAASFQPSIYPVANFWTSSPTFFFIRLGRRQIPMIHHVVRVLLLAAILCRSIS